MTITTNIKQNNLFIVMALAITTLLSLAFVLLLSPTKASAATITVGGACTLDDAVASMNAGSDQSGCTGTGAYGSGDTITLPAGTFPYGNTNTIAVPLIIQGAGMGETIVDCAGNNEGLVFDNPLSSDGEVMVEDLSISNPSSNVGLGGNAAIESAGFSATVRRVEVFANSSQEIESVIQIANDIIGNSALLEDIHIHDIATTFGAINVYVRQGINSTNNQIRRVTVNDLVGTAGSGIQVIAYAVYEGGGSISGLVENVTFSGITATDGSNVAYINAGADGATTGDDAVVDAVVQNITVISDDVSGDIHAPVAAFAIATPGVTASASLDFQNVLGAGVAAIGGTFALGLGGTETATITSLGGNIVDGADPANVLTQPTDQSGVTGLASSLGSLQDNGGITPTIALLTGSPAIDAGVANSLTTDQRGISRPQGSAYDSGAFELAVATEQPGTNDSDSETEELANTGQNRAIFIALAAVLVLPAVVLGGRRLLQLR